MKRATRQRFAVLVPVLDEGGPLLSMAAEAVTTRQTGQNRIRAVMRAIGLAQCHRADPAPEQAGKPLAA
jgi:hypothetical protein